MGTALTGLEIKDTYEGLVKTTDNGPISATAKFLSDGLGNDSVLALSTTAVGIGTAVPTQLFHVQKNSAAVYSATTPSFNTIEHIRNATSGTGANSILNFTSEPNGEWYIGCVNKANFADFVFASRDAAYGERMRITSAGNVGIGTSSPTTKFVVLNGVGEAETAIFSGDTEDRGLSISILNVGGIGQAGVNLNAQHTTSSMISFSTNSIERARITANGLTFNGDTAAANALDDYEEGTWTPSVSAGAGTFTSVTGQQGTYTKIGRQVTIQFFFVVSDKGSGTGSALITNLPFTALDTPAGGTYVGGVVNTSTLVLSTIVMDEGGASATIVKFDATDPITQGQGTAGSITYQA